MKGKIGEGLTSSLNSLKNIKTNLSKFSVENKINDLQDSVKNLVGTAKKDLENMAAKDISNIKKKVLAEKKHIEKIINQVIPAEINKAKKFVQSQKKEITKLSKKLETFVPTSKTIVKKAAKKKAAPKASVKKVAKK